MRRALPVLLALTALIQPLQADEPTIRLVELEGTILWPSANRVVRAIDDADAEGDDLVLIVLDTPGGVVDQMERIVKRMLAAETPIVVWVGPSGSKAASAGFYILIAADVAAMATGTRTGAASVVFLPGPNPEDDVLLKKANKDAAAMVRTIAEHRGRDVEACEKAVFAADAYTDAAALKEGIIDLVVRDREELLERLEGREVKRFDGSTVVLSTEGARFVTSEINFRQRFFEVLGTPVVAYLLFLLGLGGLYIEATHPGLIFPGVAGALCLLLFALSAQVLPISAIGVLLILLSMVMFILEVKVTSYGMLTFGGLLCLVIGSLMLFEGPIPELRLSLNLVLPTAITIAALCALAVQLAVRAQRRRVDTGVEGLHGEVGTVTQELAPEGKIFVHGEIWDAVSTRGPLARGARVRVVKVEEMRLTVEPAESRSAQGG